MHARKPPLTKKEQIALKIILKEQRNYEIRTIEYRENGVFSKDFKKYTKDDKVIDAVFPLLDPEFKNQKQRNKAHENWFKFINKNNAFLTSETNF